MNFERFLRQETGNVTALSEKGGLCGLSNLGNTCFMNGAVQALLHCDPLVQFFLAGKHKKELNKRNPLGMKGELALALAELTKEVWRSPVGSAVAPKQLKHVVGRFAPQFQGYQQHDSHELLAFLLDGVHEDLNRVQEKVYVDLDDIKGELDDQQRSKALWEKHELRNRSVIVDLFQAQLKSTIVCPSVTEGGF
jgi:ubiquitin C-terminal hydrolase